MENNEKQEVVKIELVENGPLLVKGTFILKYKDGQESEKKQSTALCRCGSSGNKPFCDGTHRKINFTD